MPTTKKPLKRYSILDRCFSNTGRNYTFEGLRETVNEWMLEKDPRCSGISVRQLRDDIAFMKSTDGWDAPIITVPGDGKKRYYCYDDPNFSISKRPVNETQVEELKMLVDAPDAFEGLPQFAGLEDIIEKLQSDMEIVQKPNQEKIIDWGNNEFYKGKEYFDPIVGVSGPMDGEIEKIEIQLTPESYPYVKTKPIHHIQKNYDEECKVVIKVIRNRELENLLQIYS